MIATILVGFLIGFLYGVSRIKKELGVSSIWRAVCVLLVLTVCMAIEFVQEILSGFKGK